MLDRNARGRIVPAVIVVLALVAIALNVTSAAETAKVGDLIQRIATQKGISSNTPSEAVDALRAAGFTLPDSIALEADLDEGTLAAISTAVGVPVDTAQPAAPVSGDQLDSYISTFGPDLAADGGADTRKHPNPGTDKGRGKKKGHFKSPSDPA